MPPLDVAISIQVPLRGAPKHADVSRACVVVGSCAGINQGAAKTQMQVLVGGVRETRVRTDEKQRRFQIGSAGRVGRRRCSRFYRSRQRQIHRHRSQRHRCHRSCCRRCHRPDLPALGGCPHRRGLNPPRLPSCPHRSPGACCSCSRSRTTTIRSSGPRRGDRVTCASA